MAKSTILTTVCSKFPKIAGHANSSIVLRIDAHCGGAFYGFSLFKRSTRWSDLDDKTFLSDLKLEWGDAETIIELITMISGLNSFIILSLPFVFNLIQ
ncbi:MAG: hypothetical protein AYK18_06615 [Theionarchaea archaeon DG-70]|nr:MAG: hypothetical protein AYK18_06615 [Theionarchaea archaeon DG-70]